MDEGRVFGRGISFPPRVGPDGRVAWSAGPYNIREMIRVVLPYHLRNLARIEALEQELKQKQAEAERWIGAEARRKLDLSKRRKELEHSPSAKIFKKRPDNSQGARKKTPGRRSPKGGIIDKVST